MTIGGTPASYEFPGSSESGGIGPPKTVEEAQDSKQMFLKLLVAQIKNQNPLIPQDPTEFLGQLTQYSMLEQLIMIRQGVSPDATPADTSTDPAGSRSAGRHSSGGRGRPVQLSRRLAADNAIEGKLRITCLHPFPRRYPRSARMQPPSTWSATTLPI